MRNAFIKKAFAGFILLSVLLCGCRFLESDQDRLKKEYGTIELFLKHFNKPAVNWVNSYEYENRSDRQKYYDTDGVIYAILKGASFNEVSEKEYRSGSFFQQGTNWVEYSGPYDDAANIRVYEDGYGSISVMPDLNPGMSVYFKTNTNTTELLFLRINEMLPDSN